MGRRFEEHLTNLGKVLQRLREAGLKLKPQKCYFLKDRVEYLGHIVSAEGVGVDPRKTQAVREFPQPLNLKALRSFLGLASYYKRFIPKFSSVAAPLHALTRKNAQFVWTPTCQQAFDHLKQLMTDAPVLAYPDFEQPFLLETDASGTGLGAVLAQKQEDGSVRPVAYASRTLQNHEKNYRVTELEGLGVVWATKHFRPYLYGHPCDVYTDHEALKALLNTPQPSGKLARWVWPSRSWTSQSITAPVKRTPMRMPFRGPHCCQPEMTHLWRTPLGLLEPLHQSLLIRWTLPQHFSSSSVRTLCWPKLSDSWRTETCQST